ILDTGTKVFASAGTARQKWPVGERVQLSARGQTSFQSVALLTSGAFRVSGAVLRIDDRDVGTLVLGTTLDEAYARVLAALAQAGIVITVNGAIVAHTVPDKVTRDLLAPDGDPGATRRLDGDEYAIRTLFTSGPARIYSLTSIDAAANEATHDAL